ncbi:MAG: DUF6391 domain-containing protein [Anaerolineae bacterium]
MQPSPLQRIRRNHAIEHAAMHMLSRSGVTVRLAARSDWRGLTFYGDIDSETLRQALDDGLKALRKGNSGLAVHPRCGSMVSIALMLGFVTSWLAQSGLRRGASPARGLFTLASIASAAVIARPLAEGVQAHVLTSADTGQARLIRIRRSRRGPLTIHRVAIAYD